MNGAMLHLVSNHIPVIMPPFLALLFAAAIWRRSKELAAAGYAGLVLTALLTIVAFQSGGPAAHIVRGIEGVERADVRAHSHAADQAFWAMEALGVLAIGGLVAMVKKEDLLPRLNVAALLGSVLLSAWMGWVAHLGGLIRHPEIGPDFVLPATEMDSPPK